MKLVTFLTLSLLMALSAGVTANLNTFKERCDSRCLQIYAMGWIDGNTLKGNKIDSCIRSGKDVVIPSVMLSKNVARKLVTKNSTNFYLVEVKSVIDTVLNTWKAGCDK